MTEIESTTRVQDLPNEQALKEPQLTNRFAFWTFFTKENYIMKASEYEQNLFKLAEVEDLDSFWQIYQHIRKPSALPLNSELFFFKNEIKPIWENKHNRGGGKFIIRPKKEVIDAVWERLVVEALFWDNPLFCGIDLNTKRLEISLWSKELELHAEKESFKAWVRNTLGIDENVPIEYKEHPLTEDIAPLEKDWESLLKFTKNPTLQKL